MAYAGHIRGPRKSRLIESHCPDYFGCDESDYNADIFCERATEGSPFSTPLSDTWIRGAHSEGKDRLGDSQIHIDPVHVDETGRPYIVWNAHGGTQREYIESYLDPIFLKNPYEPLETYAPEEAERYKARIAGILESRNESAI